MLQASTFFFALAAVVCTAIAKPLPSSLYTHRTFLSTVLPEVACAVPSFLGDSCDESTQIQFQEHLNNAPSYDDIAEIITFYPESRSESSYVPFLEKTVRNVFYTKITTDLSSMEIEEKLEELRRYKKALIRAERKLEIIVRQVPARENAFKNALAPLLLKLRNWITNLEIKTANARNALESVKTKEMKEGYKREFLRRRHARDLGRRR